MQLVGKMTPHPAAGNGKLPAGTSWFIDWVVNGQPVGGYHFTQEATSPKGNVRSLRESGRSFPIAGQEAGIMTPKGMWNFPPQFRNAVDDWLQMNIPNIKKITQNAIKIAIRQV